MITNIVITGISDEDEYNQAIQILKDNGGGWYTIEHPYDELSSDSLAVDEFGKFWCTSQKWPYTYLTFQEFIERYGKKENIKIGDTIICVDRPAVKEDSYKGEHGSGWSLGHKFIVAKIDRYAYGNVYFPAIGCGCFDGEVELVSEVKTDHEALMEHLAEQINNNNESINTPEMVNNGFKKTMDIVQFAKNLVLSDDEKVLREVGVKDSQGNYTSNAREIVVNLEAVALGYKSEQDLFEKVGYSNNLSSFEYASLLTKYADKLLEIAKAMKAEQDKK